MPVTMSDIAKETNSSISLVSAALKKNKSTVRVSEKKRKEILQVAQRLGYRPSHAARSLKVGKTNVIGMVLGEIHTPYYGEMSSMFMEEAERFGYSIQIYVTNWERSRSTKSIDLLLGGRCDGVIVFEGDMFNENTMQYKHIIQHQLPTVVLSNIIPGLAHVGEDWNTGFCEAAEYLNSKGIKDAVFLGDAVDNLNRLKLKALNDAFSANSIKLRFVECSNRPDLAYDFGMAFKSMKNRPKVIINENDTLATALLCGLLEAGVKVPQEVAVIGCNNTKYSKYSFPSLTTIGCDRKVYVESVINQIVSMVDKNKQFTDAIKHPTYLIRRNSA